MLDNWGHKHTPRILNIYCSSKAIMATRTRLSFTLYVYCLSCKSTFSYVLPFNQIWVLTAGLLRFPHIIRRSPLFPLPVRKMLQVCRHNIITTNRNAHGFRAEASLSPLRLLTVKRLIPIRTSHRGILVLDRFNRGRICADTHWMMFWLAPEPVFPFWREEKSLVLSGNQRPNPTRPDPTLQPVFCSLLFVNLFLLV